MSTHELSPKDVYLCCDLQDWPFKTTDDLITCEEFIGQERALSAIDLGLAIQQPGYNIYLAGPPGVGKTSSIKAILSRVSQTRPVPDDWCYVNNFDDPNIPNVIRFPTGRGKVFRNDMERFIDALKHEIPRAFESKEYDEEKQRILGEYQGMKNKLSQDLQTSALEQQFQVQFSPTGIATIPMVGGKPIDEKAYAALSQGEKEDIMKRKEAVDLEVAVVFKRVRKLDREAADKVNELDVKVASFVITDHVEVLEEAYKDVDKVCEYLGRVKDNLLVSIDDFRIAGEPGRQPMMPAFQQPAPPPGFREYRVNVFVDNSTQRGAPVIFEQHPIFTNLFGTIEKQVEMGVLTTDFTMIRAGSLPKANGGYLVLEALDVLRAPFAWDFLKKALINEELSVEDVNQHYGFVNVTGLRPEPMKIDLKVIIIGNPFIYSILYENDEDFRKLFKVKADFDSVVDRTEEMLQQYACFIKSTCEGYSLRPFAKSAVEAVIEHSSRLAGDQKKLSVQYGALMKVIVEADYWRSVSASQEHVTREHVERAIDAKLSRSGMIEDKIQEMIEEGMIHVDSEGSAVGQINGLSVLHMGDYAFGRPSRITCETFIGGEGVVNIERKAKLSGSIHDKGVLILSGYLGAKYAGKRPLSLSASLAFEQSYGMIDGDSASAAELVALLSALSGVPIRQDLAITGSIDQKGNIQPIGGVNEKIEGFFRVCRVRGLTGSQGIVIPALNVTSLMLHKDVVEAIEKGEFHIYAAGDIDEVVEVMTGMPAGERDAEGEYPGGTLNHLVSKRLTELAKDLRSFRANAPDGAPREDTDEDSDASD